MAQVIFFNINIVEILNYSITVFIDEAVSLKSKGKYIFFINFIFFFLFLNSHTKISSNGQSCRCVHCAFFIYLLIILFFYVAVRTLAGSTQGNVDGQGMNAKFNNPHGITFNPIDDCLYVCDYGNRMIRKITRSGTKC